MMAGPKARLLIGTQCAQRKGKLVKCVARATPQRQTTLRCSLPLPSLGTMLTNSCGCVKVNSIARRTRARPMAWSAQTASNHLLHVATDDTRLLARLRLRCVLLREVLPETQLAVPTVARLNCLGRFVVGLAPPCSRRLGRGWGSAEERNHTTYEGVSKNTATACHLCDFQSEVGPR